MKYLMLVLSVANVLAISEMSKLISSGTLGLALFVAIAVAGVSVISILREKI